MVFNECGFIDFIMTTFFMHLSHDPHCTQQPKLIVLYFSCLMAFSMLEGKIPSQHSFVTHAFMVSSEMAAAAFLNKWRRLFQQSLKGLNHPVLTLNSSWPRSNARKLAFSTDCKFLVLTFLNQISSSFFSLEKLKHEIFCDLTLSHH